MEKNTKIILIVILLVGTLFLIQNNNSSQDFMSVRYYDSSGKPISNSLAVVENVDVSFIDITVSVTNTGSKALTCFPSYLSPYQLDSAMSKSEKTVPIGRKASWTSDLINVTTLIGGEFPDNFKINITCFYNDGQRSVYLSPQSGNLSLKIYGQVIFRTNVLQRRSLSLTPDYTSSGKVNDGNRQWIAYDLEKDGTLEKYILGTSSRGENNLCTNLASFSVLDYIGVPNEFDFWIVNGTGSYKGFIGVCKVTDYPATGNSQIWWYIPSNQTFIRSSSKSIEPYASVACSGLVPCMERYN